MNELAFWYREQIVFNYIFISTNSNEEQEHVIMQNTQVPYGISMHVITQENLDYEHRDRKHLASNVTKQQPYE